MQVWAAPRAGQVLDMTINAQHEAFATTLADVRTGADRLDRRRARVTRQVDGLLGGGWRGDAADAFAEGWADWTRSCSGVLAGLDAMGRLLEAVHEDLVAQDTSSALALDRVSQRIVTRLDR